MDEADPQPKPKPQQKSKRAAPSVDPREARLAKALRDNLRRRKQARQAPEAGAPGGPPPPLTSLADD